MIADTAVKYVGATAPIALFVYDRVDHAALAVASLLRNPEACESNLYVFSDGARSADRVEAVQAVRNFARSISGFASVSIVERSSNWGLASSIIGGVTQLCESHGQVIVVEDDLVVANSFLKFMNEALRRYENCESVMQVAGYMFDADLPPADDAVFLSFISSWGWGTWSRAWRRFDRTASGYAALKKDKSLRRKFDLDGHYAYFRMLEAQQAGTIQSWAILWYLSVFNHRGLTLYPRRSLVYNTGFDGSGSNCKVSDIDQGLLVEDFEVTRWPATVELSAEQMRVFEALPKSRLNVSAIVSHLMRRLRR